MRLAALTATVLIMMGSKAIAHDFNPEWETFARAIEANKHPCDAVLIHVKTVKAVRNGEEIAHYVSCIGGVRYKLIEQPDQPDAPYRVFHRGNSRQSPDEELNEIINRQ